MSLITPTESWLFVYGTLKRGHGNHHVLGAARFIQQDEAPGRMYASGIPFVLEPGGTETVHGELFAIEPEDLARVDRLEGHPFSYTRSPVRLKRSGVMAQIYYWLHPVPRFAREVPSGRWNGNAFQDHEKGGDFPSAEERT